MNLLSELAEQTGISSSYIDKTGKTHITPDTTRRVFLEAMGYPVPDEENDILPQIQLSKNPILPDVLAFYDNEKIEFTPCGNGCFEAKLIDEQGKIILSRQIDGGKPCLLENLAVGYYTLQLRQNNNTYETLLIFAPEKCYLPEWLTNKEHLFGVSLMLYGLRSEESLGIGDFRDLKDIITLTAQNGGDIVGISPLGVMSPKMLPQQPFQVLKGDVSPYRTLSRLFINPMYLALKDEPDYQNSSDITQFMNTPQTKETIRRLNLEDKVQYTKVMELKLHLLTMMYQTFLASATEERQAAFASYKQEKGKELANLCLFEVLLEKHKEETFWRLWQDGTEDIYSAETEAFRLSHQSRIDFYAYCHWLADKQLKSLQNYALSLGMKIGLYADMPIGAASNGAEVWENPAAYVLKAGIGAPADPMRPRGQSWGFTPYHPHILAQQKYTPFIQLVRQNVNKAGALRIDHAMGMRRLFWSFFQEGNPVVQGAYVYYDLKVLTAILSLESNRARCLLIGEDLGTVPEGFREYMAAHGLLSYKVFFRQKKPDGTFIPPHDYLYMSLSQSSTHDQATTSGFWQNEDIEVFKSCGLYVNEEQYLENLNGRRKDRENMIKAFANEKVLTDQLKTEMENSTALGNILPQNLGHAVNIFGASTHSALYLVRLCDLCGQKILDNAPGTIDEYPNWRNKLPYSVEKIISSADIAHNLQKIKEARPK